MLAPIEKAIMASDLGIMPANDGNQFVVYAERPRTVISLVKWPKVERKTEEFLYVMLAEMLIPP